MTCQSKIQPAGRQTEDARALLAVDLPRSDNEWSISLPSHHHVKVPMEQTAATGRGGFTGRRLPGVQARRQWNDVCALGLLCVPQPHSDQTQPVVATPELRNGRLLCSCRSRPSLRLRARGAPAFVSAAISSRALRLPRFGPALLLPSPLIDNVQPLDALTTLDAERSIMPTCLATASGPDQAGLHRVEPSARLPLS